jgi:hypothetical protein
MATEENNVGTGVFPCKYKFTREELRELGLRLAARAQEIYNAKAAKKTAAAVAKARIEELEEDAAALVRKLNELNETRDIECRIHYNLPRRGMKTIIRTDTGEAEFEAPMTEAEMQGAFVFTDAAAPEKKPKKGVQ